MKGGRNVAATEIVRCVSEHTISSVARKATCEDAAGGVEVISNSEEVIGVVVLLNAKRIL